MPSQVKSRIAVGVMTGTSIDAVDACALHLHGHGLEMIAEPLGHASIPLGELAQPLRTLADDEPMRASRIARLRRMLGEACGEAIAAIGLEHAIDLIAVHGQTVHHAPPESWQMIDPFPLAHRFNARIVTDLRGLDRAAGGQGAPITPLSDWILYRHPHARAIVNLGGFINCTFLPPAEAGDPLALVRGADICACNQVLDAIARLGMNCPFDEDGMAASAGTSIPALAEDLHARLEGQRTMGRSLGSGDECLDWVETALGQHDAGDAAASACTAIASCLAAAIKTHDVHQARLAGGGTRNQCLVSCLQEALGVDTDLLDEGMEREAASMAVLGALAEDGIPITLAHITARNDTGSMHGCWVNHTP